MTTSVIINGARGRMGTTLTGIAQNDESLSLAGVLERPGHEAGLETLGCPVGNALSDLLPLQAPVAVVDFSTPEASTNLAASCADHGIPAVIATTGLTPEQRASLEEAARKTPLFWAPNMSVGLNVLLEVLPDLVRKLGPGYDLEITEIHHNRKVDSPSGTAIRLAECLAEAREWEYDDVKCHARDGIVGARKSDEIGVMAVRGGDVVGDHTVYLLGPGERIELTHRVHSREMFAQGALRAAKWLVKQQPGKLYNMKDMLK